MTFETGTRVGRYEIQSLIGVGGMGEVYRALDTELDRPAALKFLPPEVAADPRMSRLSDLRSPSALNQPTSSRLRLDRPKRGCASSPPVHRGTTLRDQMKARR